MCGIAGIISLNPNDLSKQRLQKMTDTIAHRGPEGEGYWINDSGNIGFGHRRLCIIDLSDTGAQPMYYLDRYTIVYNGEIYNYLELKQILQQHGYTFRSSGDTEVILAAYDFYGQDCLQQFDGMFAFALWDERDKILFCARDRFGEKPFYFCRHNEALLFASEMKALWAAGAPREMNNTMLLNYLTLGYTINPADNSCTFYKNIYQLPPANFLLIELDQNKKEVSSSFSTYWDLDKETIINIPENKATEQFEDLLRTSVKRRLRSDVAVGTSLSGGLDSSSIASIMQSFLSGTNSHAAFSAVFPRFEKDESKYIELAANKLSIKSFITTPTADGFINDLEKLFYHQEEPFQSASIYAQYKVYGLAKENGVTVLLDGQGADETLAGYHKYYHWYWQELIAKHQWKTASDEIHSAKSLGVNVDWNWKNYLASYLPGLTARQLEKKAYKQTYHPDISREFRKHNADKKTFYKPVVDKLNDILYFNSMQFGLQELLRYADRNSMAHSREVRLPFLNHDLVQFIFSLPSSYKIRNGWTKWILRETMHEQLPNEIVWRKDKVGFEPPQQQWMQQPQLQEYMHESKRKLVGKGILKKSTLNKPIHPESSHEAGNYDWRYLCA
ncbi:MAG: asparagine synthase (glutamine-hydrolyzing), partial [Segetibacter sp.]|nr:asparagine synthase (glutamine-hydrolyzing) [Segetibacter sp.]